MRSGRTLAGLCLLFVVAFFVQRGRSSVLRIEAERPVAERIAGEAGMTVPEVMSLRHLLGAGLPEARLREAASRFARLRRSQGDHLAVLSVAGHDDLARELWAESHQDPSLAASFLRARPESILPTRFLNMTERFARRHAP